MKTAPNGWADIVNGGNYTYECKINVAGVDVLQSGIYEMSINGSSVSSAATIGGAIAGEINVVLDIIPKDDPDIALDGGTFIWTDGASANGGTFWSGGVNKDGGSFTGIYIPKMASLIPFIRVVDNASGAMSDWLKMGEYFIDTREKDVKNGKFTAHGYDAMLKAEQTYMPSVTDGAMTTKAVVNEIAALIGVGVNASTTTILNTTYSVPYYAGQYTAREMLQYIGAAYYGSFIIDDYGNLKLIQLTSTGTNTDIGGKAKSFELSEETLTYGKVVIVTTPTEEYTAGSGDNILEFDCPFGTQAMANAILSALSSYEYRGYKAGTALITPLYEIGDSVTIKDTTVQIFKRALRFNALMASDLEAPYSEEIQHEFIYKRAEERKIERLAASTSSEFIIQNNKIEARVEKSTYNADINDPETGLKAVVANLETQVDGKIETWAQDSNPAASWTTTDLQEQHDGDLWYYTGLTTITVNTVAIEPSKTYQYNKSTNKWVEYNSPSKTLFDLADGKSTIYYGNTSGTYSGVEAGDYLVDATGGSTYRWSGTAWVEQTATAAINLLPSTYQAEYVNGTASYVHNGITWTLNRDGSVTANGTATTGGSWYQFSGNTLTSSVPVIIIDPAKRYRLHGCPSGGSTSKYRIIARVTPEGTTPTNTSGTMQSEVGNGLTLNANMKYVYVYAFVSGGVTVSNITFYPMLEVGTVSHAYVSSHENTAALLTNGIDALRDDLEGQIDSKIQTWVSGTTTTPSAAWTTDTERAKHVGDLWYYNGTSSFGLSVSGITVEPSKTYQYYLDGSTYKWRAYNEPSESLFDYADGKSTIYYGTTSGTYDGVETGDYLVDSSSGNTYRWSGTAWAKMIAAPAVNLLPPVYRREYLDGDTYTLSGITWKVNADGSVTANGTASATAYYVLTAGVLGVPSPVASFDPAKRYRLHGCPSGGASTKYRLRCRCTLDDGSTPSASAGTWVNDSGSGVNLLENSKYGYVLIEIANGYTASDLTFYPMLEEGTVSHDYVSSHTTGAAYTSAQFTILDDAIQSKVSQTDYNGNEIASLINQTATTVAISADKLTFDGKTVTINSGGFTVSGSGSSWSFINLTYSNYNAKLNPQGITLANTTTKNQVNFYSSGMWFKYNDVNRLTIGAGSDGTPYFYLYDASSVNILEITSAGNMRFKYNGSNVIWTTRSTGAINAAAFNPTSRIETKSNIKKATGALDKILGTDILSYNLKIENDKDKRHTGVVIGGKYKVPDDIVAVDEDGTASGVDLYSMVSISWKAIQELKAEVDELKGGK